MQNYLNLEYTNNDYFYTNNIILFFSSYGIISMLKHIFLIIVQIYIDLRQTQDKSVQVCEIENENVILKKRKLI
jgi:hypothetical protein